MSKPKATRGQDEFTRARRIAEGRCPTHGLGLSQDGLEYQNGEPIGETVECPRKDCDFKHVPVVKGAKGLAGRLYAALHGAAVASIILTLVGCADATFDVASEEEEASFTETSIIGIKPTDADAAATESGDASDSSPSSIVDSGTMIDSSSAADAAADTAADTALDASAIDTAPDASAIDTGTASVDTGSAADTMDAGASDAPKTLFCGLSAGYYRNAEVTCYDLATSWCARSINCGAPVSSMETCRAAKMMDFGCYKSSTNVVCTVSYSQCNADITSASCPLGSGGSYRLGTAESSACKIVLDQNAARLTQAS